MRTFKQTVSFKCKPEEIYEALMDSKKHSSFTGDMAKISRKEGGSYSTYGSYITGKNLELVPGKKIVQTWRSTDFTEADPDSVVTYSISRIPGGCKLSFTQKGIPEHQNESVRQGWIDFYWNPMKKVFSE